MNALQKITILLIIICFLYPVFGQDYVVPDKPMKYWTKEQIQEFLENQINVNFLKPTGPSDRRFGTMDGNKIRTLFYNYGSIGRPNTEPSIEWPKESGHGYAYEFGPVVGAEVVDSRGDTVHIMSDAPIDGGDLAPGGKVRGWQPLPQYLNPTAETPAMSNNPASWPQTQNTSNPFYNVNNTGSDDMFLWPGLDSLGKQSADLEAFWVMDDRDNDEFAYYPFGNDSLRRGLGVELTCRLLQFNASLAEDIIFYIVNVKNVSDKPLSKIVVGMFGDPHIGGPGDFSDDYADFDITTGTVYSWDAPGSGNDYSIPWEDLGWLGFKFLESPKDSLGNELGLTSMSGPLYGFPTRDDEQFWETMTPGYFGEIAQNQDNIFVFGSGYFTLLPGESQQFSIAILMGKGLDDLNSNGDIAQRIYDLNYKFTKAPIPPKVTAVPADGKVTLYWDTRSEKSFDDFFGAYDFEGYKVYRSTNKIDWGEPITDINGAVKFYKPLAQFDLDNDISGFFPEQELGTSFFLGKNTGLQHTFVDENVTNGITYYYAVTAYDSGHVTPEGIVQPAESGREDGVNMVSVMPRAKIPGYVDPQIELLHTEGFSSGILNLETIDPKLIDGRSYNVFFTDTSSSGKTFSIFYESPGNNDTIYVVENSSKLFNDPITFDGLIVTFHDENKITVVDSLSGWTEGSNSTLNAIGSLYPTNGLAIPRDIEIRFYNTIVDTSILVNPKPVNFEVWNSTDNKKMEFIFFDNNNNDTVNIGDLIVPIVYQNNVPRGTWQVKMATPSDTNLTIIPPSNGDVLEVFISKPFETIDKYTITTEPASVDAARAKKEFLDKVAVVPNPYIVTSSFEVPPPSVFSQGRGDRRVDFIHLPPKCTIRIYTTSGELVRILEHNVDIYDDRESWDLLTREGLEIAYGIYVFHIDAGEYGEKIGKFAIIK